MFFCVFLRIMPPRRNQGLSAENAEIATLIAQQMAAAIPALVAQLNQAANPSVNQPIHAACSLKHFNSCDPSKFFGSEGATGLLQWFESMENTFTNSECPENLKVRYAMSVLQKRALTWWNGEKRNRGADTALALPWNEVKDLMLAEFCPRNEIIKLEEEFTHLKQVSGENLLYTTRFHELSLLVPHQVTPVSRAVEKYVRGLPREIQDTVWGSKPTTLGEAISMAATLTDNHVKAGTLLRKSEKKEDDKSTAVAEAEPELPAGNQKRSVRNFATTQTPAKRPYGGNHPQCNTCHYHHPPTAPCRLCSHCNRYGHLASTCRLLAAPGNDAPAQANRPAQGRVYNINVNNGAANPDQANHED